MAHRNLTLAALLRFAFRIRQVSGGSASTPLPPATLCAALGGKIVQKNFYAPDAVGCGMTSCNFALLGIDYAVVRFQ